MTHACRPYNCIVPPHILNKLLESRDKEIREMAMRALFAATNLRAERSLIAEIGFAANIAGTRARTVYDCKRSMNTDQAVPVRAEGAPPTQDGSVNRAYDGLGKTHEFYQKVFGRNSIDDRGMRLDAYVHYGDGEPNAYWNGRQMLFGDGDGQVFTDFTLSLDVIGHELAHGVTQFTAGLEYHNQPGALNESLSDVFGSLVKQYALGQSASAADWLIGQEIFTPDLKADALRSMKAPGTAYSNSPIGDDPQPAHMKDYARLPDTRQGDWGGVHINSGIPNHAFYLLATALGGNAWEIAGNIWYQAMLACSQKTDFQGFADKTYSVAGRLHGAGSVPQQEVGSAWSKVGIEVSQRSLARAGRTDEELLSQKMDSLMTAINALSSQVAQLQGASRAKLGKSSGRKAA